MRQDQKASASVLERSLHRLRHVVSHFRLALREAKSDNKDSVLSCLSYAVSGRARCGMGISGGEGGGKDRCIADSA